MNNEPISVKDISYGDVAKMSWMERAIWNQRQSPIPPALKDNVLAWWDAGFQKDIVLPFTQVLPNGDFSNGTTGFAPLNSTLSAAGGVLSCTGNNTAANPGFYTVLGTRIGQTRGIRYRVRVLDSVCSSITFDYAGFSGTAVVTPVANQWYEINTSYTDVVNNASAYITSLRAVYADTATANGKVLEIDIFNIYELDDTFGKGNTPTATEFAAILANSWLM